MKSENRLLLFLFALAAPQTAFGQNGCLGFSDSYNKARTLVGLRRLYERNLENDGLIMTENDIGYKRNMNDRNGVRITESREADIYTETARLIADKNQSALSSFEDGAACLRRPRNNLPSHAKYRSISGYGNNLKNPYWGAAGTPFARFGPKAYDDDIHSVRKSASGSELPNPRRIVQNVLLKAEKTPRTTNIANQLISLFVLYLTHDLAHQGPVNAYDGREEIRCCSSGNKKVLSPPISHSACMAIPIPEDDPFYKPDDVKCLNLVRSQLASEPSRVQYGEIKNKATAFLDHSIVYGTDDSELRKIRTYTRGKLRVARNSLPTDRNGNYLENSVRLTIAPVGAIWPSIFTRNHNNVAEGLAAVNPQWSDETLFLEARRINIAILQNTLFKGRVIESVFHKRVNESYNATVDPSITVEFTTAAYRLGHFYLQNSMLMVDKGMKETNIPLSDTLGRIDLLEKNFDDVLRGSLFQPLNFVQYTDEVTNKFAKNKKGVGLDLVSIDIQRGRDHGLPTFLDARRKCGFNTDFKTFDDLVAIFPKANVELLKETYEHIEDIDLLVGGTLETFTTIDTVLAGDTMGCIIGEQYRHTMAGDAYFYSHPTNPYPFTDAQLNAIYDFTFLHLLCKNANIEYVTKIWFLLETPTNPKVYCKDLKPLNFSAWKA